jgi:ADP-heptose:LPS heptosyltransferase
MELAHALRVAPADLAGHVPYLNSGPPAASPKPDGTELAVGIVWEAGGWDRRRSLPASFLRELADIPGIRLHALQLGPARAEAEALGLRDLANDHIAEAAARMRALDLVISVDTMAAHLAGALGVPVWTLLHAHCDWRWMQARSDSPWYPTMRLFRQDVPGDWRGVVNDVQAALAELACGRNTMKKKIIAHRS